MDKSEWHEAKGYLMLRKALFLPTIETEDIFNKKLQFSRIIQYSMQLRDYPKILILAFLIFIQTCKISKSQLPKLITICSKSFITSVTEREIWNWRFLQEIGQRIWGKLERLKTQPSHLVPNRYPCPATVAYAETIVY